MADATHIPLENSAGYFVEPPVVDLLYFEPASDSFVLTFIPEDAVSKEQKEAISIATSSIEGKRLAAWLEELGKMLDLNGSVRKLFHRGGGDFGFYGPGDSEVFLSSSQLSSAIAQEAYRALQDIAQIAQIAFLLSRQPPATGMKTLSPHSLAVEMQNGAVLRGSAEGNNASWLCACGYKSPLIGTTRSGAGDTRCPNCGRMYRTYPYPHRGQAVTSVKEIEAAKASA
jgi:hypothetical protein